MIGQVSEVYVQYLGSIAMYTVMQIRSNVPMYNSVQMMKIKYHLCPDGRHPRREKAYRRVRAKIRTAVVKYWTRSTEIYSY